MRQPFLVILSIPLFVFLASCSLDTPPQIGRDNPLDPNNPDTRGDPYRLRAELADGGVKLTWQAVNWPPLVGYNIYRREDNGAYGLLRQVRKDTTYTDRNIRNGHRYEYYVVARSSTGVAEASYVASVLINVEPVIIIEGENVTHTPTRRVTLTIIAFGGRRMLLSNTSDFSGAEWEPFVVTREWELESGVGTKRVYLRVVYDSGDTSQVVSDQIEPSSPVLHSVVVAGGAATTPTRNVSLRISATGATEMKVSNTPFTGAEPWIPFADSIQWQLSTGAGTKTVYVKVRND
ncbi:MAG: fibronectin type III domain-containing protein, partial [Nitrososphaerota archaeon]